eukprot:COSAG02_NODE_1938_length_10312_cov_16.495741_11_plen_98_part_00
MPILESRMGELRAMMGSVPRDHILCSVHAERPYGTVLCATRVLVFTALCGAPAKSTSTCVFIHCTRSTTISCYVQSVCCRLPFDWLDRSAFHCSPNA